MEESTSRAGSEGEQDIKPDVILISVASRIPDFWTDQPDLWFIQFEAAVSPQKSSDDAKYQLLISKLGKKVIQQVSDLLASPPSSGKYNALKSRLVNIYQESETRRVMKLIGEMQLGDQKPSQLLRQMKRLDGERMQVDTLLVLWQNHLPASMRGVLAATSLTDGEKLAEVADKILESSKPVDVASISHHDSHSMAAKLEKLIHEVAELRAASQRSRGRSRQSSRSQSRRGSQSRSSNRDPNRLCYYHYRFKEKAEKCRKPCGWQRKDGNEDKQGN